MLKRLWARLLSLLDWVGRIQLIIGIVNATVAAIAMDTLLQAPPYILVASALVVVAISVGILNVWHGWHALKVPDLELTPASGLRSDLPLAVKNKDADGQFHATCRILHVRGDMNLTKTDPFPLAWTDTTSQKQVIVSNDSKKLLVAMHSGLRESSSKLPDMLEVSLREWSPEGHSAFESCRWVIRDDAALPEYDIEISIFRDGVQAPLIRSYTVLPQSRKGPLMMKPLQPDS